MGLYESTIDLRLKNKADMKMRYYLMFFAITFVIIPTLSSGQEIVIANETSPKEKKFLIRLSMNMVVLPVDFLVAGLREVQPVFL